MYKPRNNVVPDFDADGIGALPRRHRGPTAAAPHQRPGAASPPGSNCSRTLATGCQPPGVEKPPGISTGSERRRRWRPPRDVPTSGCKGESPPNNTLLINYIDSNALIRQPAFRLQPYRDSASTICLMGTACTVVKQENVGVYF